MKEFESRHPYVPRLIEAGELEASQERHAEAAAYFSPNFRFHGAAGVETDLAGLDAYFASLRAAFPDLKIWREAVFGEGPYLAARTRFRGTFTNTFTMSPAGPVEPHGGVVEWEVMNIFRFDEEGRIAEEWVKTDPVTLVRALGASLTI